MKKNVEKWLNEMDRLLHKVLGISSFMESILKYWQYIKFSINRVYVKFFEYQRNTKME